jgi:hypothetical protein
MSSAQPKDVNISHGEIDFEFRLHPWPGTKSVLIHYRIMRVVAPFAIGGVSSAISLSQDKAVDYASLAMALFSNLDEKSYMDLISYLTSEVHTKVDGGYRPFNFNKDFDLVGTDAVICFYKLMGEVLRYYIGPFVLDPLKDMRKFWNSSQSGESKKEKDYSAKSIINSITKMNSTKG